jgi:cold shock CspA family protein
MTWFSGSFADKLFGAARRIFDSVLGPAVRARADWERQYITAEAAIAEQHRAIDIRISDHNRTLSLAEITALHSQSKYAADLAHGALLLARRSLDALGLSIVETARQRQALERRAASAWGATRATLQHEINSLHQLRDIYLIPDKDRVKAERDRLLSEVRRLNKRTAEFRDIKNQHSHARALNIGRMHSELPAARERATVKFFNSAREFGFLIFTDGREIYFNSNNVTQGTPLHPGATVWCRVQRHQDGRYSATQVSWF